MEKIPKQFYTTEFKEEAVKHRRYRTRQETIQDIKGVTDYPTRLQIK